MSDVKWIRITTDIFSDEKIMLIESLPNSDKILVVWFKLLCLAGQQNNNGMFTIGNKPYTEKMLSAIFRRKLSTVQLALKTFEQYGMIEVVDGIITIPNWCKHQNLEQIQARKEYQKNYQREYRKKQIVAEEKTDSKCLRKHLHEHLCKHEINTLEEDKEIDKEIDKDIKEKEIEKEKEKINYQLIADMYNDTCVSFPKLKFLSDARKKAIKARMNTYTIDDFRVLFEKAEASDFLKGKNGRNWTATFDWLLKDANMAKVLDGNYDNKAHDSQSINRDSDYFERWANA